MRVQPYSDFFAAVLATGDTRVRVPKSVRRGTGPDAGGAGLGAACGAELLVPAGVGAVEEENRLVCRARGGDAHALPLQAALWRLWLILRVRARLWIRMAIALWMRMHAGRTIPSAALIRVRARLVLRGTATPDAPGAPGAAAPSGPRPRPPRRRRRRRRVSASSPGVAGMAGVAVAESPALSAAAESPRSVTTGAAGGGAYQDRIVLASTADTADM